MHCYSMYLLFRNIILKDLKACVVWFQFDSKNGKIQYILLYTIFNTGIPVNSGYFFLSTDQSFFTIYVAGIFNRQKVNIRYCVQITKNLIPTSNYTEKSK